MLDRVLKQSKKIDPHPSGLNPVRSQYQRPAISSTRSWIYDTEKLVHNVAYAERSAAEMRGASSRVLSRDRKECGQLARGVDREVKSTVDSTAATMHQLERAIAAHQTELMNLLNERNAARDALGRVVRPLEQVRKRIEIRIENPLPLEERTDTSVLESLQIVSRSLSESSKALVDLIKEAERHCTHMESLRQAIRLEITDRRESMHVAFAGSHEVDSLPPISSRGGDFGGGGGGHSYASGSEQIPHTEYAQMLKSDMMRCLRLSSAGIAESVLLRSKLQQCVNDVEIVRKRNEKLLSITLEAHVKDTETLQRALSERKAAVKAEIDKLKVSEAEAHAALESLQAPAQMAQAKLKDRVRYSRVLRDGRAQDSVSMATQHEAQSLKTALQDAQRCEATLAKHRQRLEGFYDQLSSAELSKAKVMQLALSTAVGAKVEPASAAAAAAYRSPRVPNPPKNNNGNNNNNNSKRNSSSRKSKQ